MAKNAQKTNALGLELSPSSFKTSVEKEQVPHAHPVEAPTDILASLETDKPVIKGFSFTLREDNVKKLRALAKSQGVSASKMLDHILSEVIK